MTPTLLRIAVLVLPAASLLQAALPDIGNLEQCIQDVRHAAAHLPTVLTFDSYKTHYSQLVADLETAAPHLPHVYQESAVKPLLRCLAELGESKFLRLFEDTTNPDALTQQQIIADAALAILAYEKAPMQGVDAFEEIVSDIYDGFLGDEARVGKQTGRPINPPTYGSIPPLVKFGNEEDGPYTWPGDDTSQALGMGCGVVSLPPAQLQGGLIAWSSLGHETGGHDVLHADEGLLQELGQKVHQALLQKFHSRKLADYWVSCLDETASDVCEYLNMGPSAGIGLIGYFRALGDGKLRTVGSTEDPHPIDLLRGYLAAAVVKRLHFRGASSWSQLIAEETDKDKSPLYLSWPNGKRTPFPVSFNEAVASTDVVAQVLMQSPLNALQGHALQELQDWTDRDQAIVDTLISVLKKGQPLPADLQGPGFYAAHVVAAATEAALQSGADIPTLFGEMLSFLVTMHRENPTWSTMPTPQSMALLERGLKGAGQAAVH